MLPMPCMGLMGVPGAASPSTPSLGPELAVNGTFDVDSNWTKGVSWSIAGGRAVRTTNAVGSIISQAYPLTAGKTYQITFEYFLANGTFQAVLRGGTSVFGGGVVGVGSSGVYSANVTALTGNTSFDITASSAGFTGEFDNYSIREVL